MFPIFKRFTRIKVYTLNQLYQLAHAVEVLFNNENHVGIRQFAKLLSSIQIFHVYHTEMVSGPVRAGQQHLKFSQKDIEEADWIKGCSKAFFLDTGSAAKIGMFIERKGSLAQNIHVEGRHIFSGHGVIFLKNDIHRPMKLIFDRPMLAYCVGKAVYIRQRGNKKASICAYCAISGYV